MIDHYNHYIVISTVLVLSLYITSNTSCYRISIIVYYISYSASATVLLVLYSLHALYTHVVRTFCVLVSVYTVYTVVCV